jgi:hypothetical protein
MIGRFVILTCALVALAGQPAASHAQTRDLRATAAPAKGTAELSVLVTTDATGSEPLRRVSVAIQAGELDVPHIGVTGDDGRVVFRNLAAGNYLLTASRNGYVRTFYGSSLPGRGPGVAVTVLDGQRVTGVRIRMLRGSVITGVVRNAAGRPAPNQQVQAIMVRSAGGEKRAINLEATMGAGLGMVTTDDRGTYRIFGLAPGDYIVSVPALGLTNQDMRPMTAAELAWADKAVAAAAGGVSPASSGPAPGSASPVAYSPVYFPGTTLAADAGVITLGPNEERAGVDFSLQLVPTAQLRGLVVDSDGRPQSGVSVSLRPTQPDGLDLFASLLNASARTGMDGTFTLQSVKPGSYTLSARATPRAAGEPAGAVDPAAARQAAIAELGLFGGGAGFTHWASEDVTVQGRDIPDLMLTLRPGMTVTGKVVYDAATKTPPTDLSRTPLTLVTAPTGTGLADITASLTGGAANLAAKIAPDGSFTIAGVAPGRYRLNTPFGMIPMPMIAAMAGGWTLKGVMYNGRDIADAPIEIKPGADVSGVVVSFTDRPSELSGTVVDGAGRVTPNFPIVVFSTDRQYWTLASRRVQQARPASDGRFKVTGLPAGEYFVCAVTAVDRTEVYDPAFLEQLVPVSFKITIADGEKKVQDLKLGGG